MAEEILVTASSWATTVLWISFSMFIRRAISFLSRLSKGMPVIVEITSQTSFSVTIFAVETEFSESCKAISSRFFWSLVISSLVEAASSNSWFLTKFSFLFFNFARAISIFSKSDGSELNPIFLMAPASSNTSIALSGKKRPEISRWE